MELEQMSYYEALKWLAKKYGIEIKEREMTDKERSEEHERESMLAINDFAMKHFEHTIADTEDGQNIGMAYFKERGINEWSVKRFHLGYSLEKKRRSLQRCNSKGLQRGIPHFHRPVRQIRTRHIRPFPRSRDIPRALRFGSRCCFRRSHPSQRQERSQIRKALPNP